jgi:hypothetical protein
MTSRVFAGVGSALVLGLLLSSSSAHAGAKDTQGLFTDDGVEITVDPRVCTLYAMLNGLGFDGEGERGPAPLFRPKYTEARNKTRSSMSRQGVSLRDLAAVVDKYPEPASAYLAAALELSDAPQFDAPESASPLAKAIADPMRTWFNEEGGTQVLRQASSLAKPAQKHLLPLLDTAIKATTKLVRLGDSSEQLLDDTGADGRVAVVINELDDHGTLQRAGNDKVTVIAVGPSRNDDDDQHTVDAATIAYARTLTSREVGKALKPGTIAEGFTKLSAKARSALVDEKGYATELLACTFMKVVRGGAKMCAGSPLVGEPEADAAVAVLLPRAKAYADDGALLAAALPTLLAPIPAPAPPPAPEPTPPPAPTKKKGK